MSRSRSRFKTEERFQKAVLELVARKGFRAVGINAVAQEAGADKVLIYRYFGNLDGLFKHVAKSRLWMPASDDVFNSFPHKGLTAPELFGQVCHAIEAHLKRDPVGQALMTWRKAEQNSLTDHFSAEWQQLWKLISLRLSTGLNDQAQAEWQQACTVAALIVESNLCGEPVEANSLKWMAEGLSVGILPETLSEIIDSPEQDACRRIDLPFPEFLTPEN